MVVTDYTPESGARETRRLLSSPEPPTAIVFDSDLLAVTGLGVAQQMGFDVPDDLSLIGWDDSLISRVVHPPLTAITRDIGAYGATAARHLLAVLDGAARQDVEVARGELTPRGSTAPPRSALQPALRAGLGAGCTRAGSPCARCGNPASSMHETRMTLNRIRLTLNRISAELQLSPYTLGDERRHGRVDRGSTESHGANHATLSSNQSEFCNQREEWRIMVRRRKWALGLGLIAVVAVIASLTTTGAGAQQQSALALPRNATLYTSGTAWSPFAQFNPLRSSGNSTGTLGLLYESLFRYDPLKDKYIPWLATDGKWVGRTYVLHIRPGVKWNDGKPFTGQRREVHLRDGQAPGLRALDDVEDRPLDDPGQG